MMSKGDTWRIETDASLQRVLETPGCPELFTRTLSGTISWQARNETPVRRVLRAPQLAPQWVGALLALGARVTVESEEEPVPLTIADGSDARELRLNLQGWHWGVAHVARTPADEPIVAAVAAVRMDGPTVKEARVALTGVWPDPVQLAGPADELCGGPLDRSCIAAVAEAIEEAVDPPDDFRGGAAYRRDMAGVMARRALEECLKEADNG